jgi:hypothetical protein
MNLNLINLNPSDWSKEDWQDAYNQAMLGDVCCGMSKQQYYDFVIANHKKIEERNMPLSEELKSKWIYGKKSCKQLLNKQNTDNCVYSEDYVATIKELELEVKRLDHNINSWKRY